MADYLPVVRQAGKGAEIAAPDRLVVKLVQNDATKEPTGFEDPSAITVSYSSAARTVTLTQAGGVIYWFRGVRYTLTSPWTSAAHTATAGSWFLSFSTGGMMAWSSTPWSLETDGPVCYVNYDTPTGTTFAVREVHGLMAWQTHLELHERIGTYRRSGGDPTAGTYTLDTDTNAAITPGFDAAVVADEDLPSTIPALTEGGYTHMRIAAGSLVAFRTAQAYLTYTTGTYPMVNNPATGAETAIVNGDWINVYQILVPTTSDAGSQTYRTVFLQPQAVHGSLAAAQAEDYGALSLGNLATLAPEFVPYARLTFQAQAPNTTVGKVNLKGITYLTGSRSSSAAAGGASWGSISGTLSAQTDLQVALDLKAPLADPAFTGNPTAPTQAPGSNSTRIATTAFVNAEIATDALVIANDQIATHVLAADPHTQYQKESEKAAANGYASLDGSTLVPAAQLPVATTTTKGAVILATSGEATAGEVVEATDSRLTNSRAPTAHVLDSASHTISGKTAGQVMLATAATTYAFTTISGDATLSGAGALAIGANKVALGQMAQVATGTFLGRTTALTGNVEALTVAQAKAMLAISTADVAGLGYFATGTDAANLTGTVAAARLPAMTGDVTAAAGSHATTIAADAVTNAKLANMAANTIKGNNTAGSANPLDLTVAQVKTLLAYTAADVSAVPTTRTVSAGTGLTGGGALSADITLTVAYGSTSTTACVGNDSRLTNSRTPTAHATTHEANGADALAWTTIHGRGTTASKPAAAAGNAGYLYFDTTLTKLQRSTGAAWEDVAEPAAAVADGDKGDITVSGGGATWSIDAGAVGSTELAANAVTNGKAAVGAIPFLGRIVNNAAISITAAATATIDRLHVVAGTSASYTITMPAVSSGAVIAFIVADIATANFKYKLDAGAGVKIAGRTRYLTLVHTNVVYLYCDGTNWLPLVLNLDSPWTDGGNIQITASTTNPTKGTTTVDELLWRRIGDSVEVRAQYAHAAAGTAGSGDYRFGIPAGMTIDSAKLSIATATVYPGVGVVSASISGVTGGSGQVSAYDSTKLQANLAAENGGTYENIRSTFYQLSNANMFISFDATLPIVDW